MKLIVFMVHMIVMTDVGEQDNVVAPHRLVTIATNILVAVSDTVEEKAQPVKDSIQNAIVQAGIHGIAVLVITAEIVINIVAAEQGILAVVVPHVVVNIHHVIVLADIHGMVVLV